MTASPPPPQRRQDTAATRRAAPGRGRARGPRKNGKVCSYASGRCVRPVAFDWRRVWSPLERNNRTGNLSNGHAQACQMPSLHARRDGRRHRKVARIAQDPTSSMTVVGTGRGASTLPFTARSRPSTIVFPCQTGGCVPASNGNVRDTNRGRVIAPNTARELPT